MAPVTHAESRWRRSRPLRGGKHAFFEVTSFVSGPLIPADRRGTVWSGMAASADWHKTITEGVAGGTVPDNTGRRSHPAPPVTPAFATSAAASLPRCPFAPLLRRSPPCLSASPLLFVLSPDRGPATPC